jgi:hypothetical protein
MSSVVPLPRDHDRGSAVDNEARLWHVTVTVGGDPQEPTKTHAALVRLLSERPFIHSARYGDRRAEIRYWEESRDMLDAASLALRLWTEHRTSADLPDWEIVGLEVVDQETYHSRGANSPVRAGVVMPMRF